MAAADTAEEEEDVLGDEPGSGLPLSYLCCGMRSPKNRDDVVVPLEELTSYEASVPPPPPVPKLQPYALSPAGSPQGEETVAPPTTDARGLEGKPFRTLLNPPSA
jgi:hypothetical protein